MKSFASKTSSNCFMIVCCVWKASSATCSIFLPWHRTICWFSVRPKQLISVELSLSHSDANVLRAMNVWADDEDRTNETSLTLRHERIPLWMMLGGKYFKYFSFTLRHSPIVGSMLQPGVENVDRCCSCECLEVKLSFHCFPFQCVQLISNLFSLQKREHKCCKRPTTTTHSRMKIEAKKRKQKIIFRWRKGKKEKFPLFDSVEVSHSAQSLFWTHWVSTKALLLPLSKGTLNNKHREKNYFQVIAKFKWKLASCWFFVPLFFSSHFLFVFLARGINELSWVFPRVKLIKRR